MSKNVDSRFELPGKLEKIFAALAVFYGQKGKDSLQRLLVNAKYSVREETSYDNWNGGTYGHEVRFQVPPPIYFEVFGDINDVREELKHDINRLGSIDNEFIDDAIIELQEDDWLDNWRENSGLLLHNTPLKVPASEDELSRIWKPGFLRVFLSHKSEFKKEASDLRDRLTNYGVSCFVAHEDIKPTKEWQDEIEKALFSMHILVALLTDDFHDSDWTDQEIGVAIGRGIPVISIRLGKDPYGFIGKYQGLPGRGKKCHELANDLIGVLGANSEIADVFTAALVTKLEASESFDQANKLVAVLNERLTTASPNIIKRLESAPNSNSQVRDAFKVKELLPRLVRRLKKPK